MYIYTHIKRKPTNSIGSISTIVTMFGYRQHFFFVIFHLITCLCYGTDEFAKVSGTRFVMGGEPYCPNGFNAYWMMLRGASADERGKVSVAMQQASGLGLNVVRTWAFSDGGYMPLQISPGSYDEDMFQGLDFVIAEAKKYGIYVIPSLVNSNDNYGGRKQYVEWARELDGQFLTSDDDFYTNSIVRGYYKNHVKTVLTRINTITGIAYKDEPTIFAWELMNEPRCMGDPSGKTLQDWITEMAAYVKSMDNNHLLEVGLEGFYGESMPGRMQLNVNQLVGSDFIANNLVPEIDFTTIHAYPDLWISESDDESQMTFLRSWMRSHIYDAASILKKPLVVTEFGKSSTHKDTLYATVYSIIEASAKAGRPCTGGLFWQLLLGEGMDELRDGFEIILNENPSIAKIIAWHSQKIRNLRKSYIGHKGSEPTLREEQ